MSWLINLVLGLWKAFLEPRPTRAENNAREAVTAEVALASERATDEKVKAAVVARDAAQSDGVSVVAQADPNNRAN